MARSPSTKRSSRRIRTTTRSFSCWALASRPGDRDGSTLGALKFDSDTALYFRREILRPFLARYLKDGAPKADVAPGHGIRNRHQHVAALDRVAVRMCERLRRSSRRRCIWTRAESRVLDAAAGERAFEEYVSDPAKPVPFRARPIQPIGYDPPLTWVAVAGGRSARSVGPAGRAGVHVGRADRAGEDQRRADRQSDCLNERHGFRLGREAD